MSSWVNSGILVAFLKSQRHSHLCSKSIREQPVENVYLEIYEQCLIESCGVPTISRLLKMMSLLQKSPIKGTIFCSENVYLEIYEQCLIESCGVPTISRLLKMMCLFCTRAL